MGPVTSWFFERIRWHSVPGLFGYTLLIFAVTGTALRMGGLPAVFSVSGAGVGACGHTICWIVARRVPRFGDYQVGILVALHCSGSISDQRRVRSTLDSIVNHLSAEAQLQDLGEFQVSVKAVPGHIRVESPKKADEISRKSGAACLIWSHAIAGAINGRDSIDLQRVAFLVRHRPLTDPQQATLKADLELVLQGDAKYSVALQNDVIDLPIVSRNLAVVARYQLGLSLAATGFRDAASALLTATIKEDTDGLPHKAKAKQILSILEIAPWAQRLPLPGYQMRELVHARDQAEAALALDPKNIHAYSILISSKFLLGDLNGAMAANGTFKNLLGSDLPSGFFLNQAVFRLHDGKFDMALVSYRNAMKNLMPFEMAREAILWLTEAVEHIDDRFCLGVAILNDRYYDPILAIDAYERCLSMVDEGTKTHRYVTERITALRVSGSI